MKLGDQLLSVFELAKTSVRIAAPFIKAHTLGRALSVVSDEIEVTCITRWRPEDIASGACDLEIFDLLEDRKQSSLLIHPLLHAKFFAADTTCLVGSANLSEKALGWGSPPNSELLIQINTSDHGIEPWWSALKDESIEATEDIRSAIEREATKLQASRQPILRPETDQTIVKDEVIWIPECPRWTGLWEVYSGDEEQLPRGALASAKSDLAALCLHPGLDRNGFERSIKTAFRHTSLFHELDQLSREGLTDLAAYSLLVEKCAIRPQDTQRRWQVIKRWLSELYPEEFLLEVNQEVLFKGRML